MRCLSTRGAAPAVNINAALLAGLAPDGGLYVPESMPSFVPEDFADCSTLPEVATHLLEPMFRESSLGDDLSSLCHSAMNFPAPIERLRPPSTWLLKLFHGPTAAFKDFGARFLAEALSQLRAADEPTRTILVATSGDTGAAVAAAFHRRPGFRVVILYPDGRVAPRQAHQLGCFGDNVSALRVAGSFDDCQRLAKQALTDPELQAQCPLSSANSISLGRLLPQMAYFAHAALAHFREHGRKPGFVVPTGNLGNALACVLARRCGLPIGPIVLANNANHVLSDFFSGSDYQPQPSIETLANAMDVGAPSNFERLRYWFPDDAELRASLRADWVDDEEIRKALAASVQRYGTQVCPHTATALVVLERLRAHGETGDFLVAATAHPAKFDSVIEPLTGVPVLVPPALAALLERPSQAKAIRADYAMLCDEIMA